jgi:flagellar hook assembly protein FlgD
VKEIYKTKEKMMTKGTNWIKGFALLGMMVAMVGVFASAPASASANTMLCNSDAVGKIGVYAKDAVKGDAVSGATVGVYNENGVLVTKGTTDANGYFTTYSCAGTFKVKVFANSYKEYGEVVTVVDNATSTVKADLQPSSPRLARR